MNNQTTQLPNRYEVDPTLPPIVIVYTRKDGIESITQADTKAGN